MTVGLDVNFSDKVIGMLARSGHIIVAVAEKGEPDEDWLSRAVSRGADIILSQDLDIPNLLDQWNSTARWFEDLHSFERWLAKQRKGGK